MLSDYRFLIVDDMQAMRPLLSSLLRQVGVSRLHFASKLRTALATLQTEAVDIVLCDLTSFSGVGLQLLRHVRGSPPLAGTPFLFLTGDTKRDSIVAAIEAGADDVIVKPFSTREFLRRCERLAAGGRRATDTAPEGTASGAPEPARDEKPTVLAVDDESANLDILVHALRDDYRVVVATGGRKALEMCRRDRAPDLILLDILMPDLDGYRVCERLKADHLTQDIPVLFVTAAAEVDDARRGFALGAVDYITKPFEPDLLRARVRTHLDIKQHRDRLQLQVDSLVDNVRQRDAAGLRQNLLLHGALASIVEQSRALLDDAESDRRRRGTQRSIHSLSLAACAALETGIDLHRIEQGELEFAPVALDLPALLEQAILAATPAVQAQDLDIEVRRFTDACRVLGQPRLCRNLLFQLLQLAIATAAGGTTLRITVERDSECGILRLYPAVADATAAPESLFSKPSPGGAEDRYGGSGYAAWMLSKVQGGSIERHARDPSETVLSLRLPAAP